MMPKPSMTVEALPLERSEDQGLLLWHMARLNQRLLGPWDNAEGQSVPRLTLTEAVAQCYEWSTEYRDHPQLASDFALVATRLARRLPPAGARSHEEG